MHKDHKAHFVSLVVQLRAPGGYFHNTYYQLDFKGSSHVPGALRFPRFLFCGGEKHVV